MENNERKSNGIIYNNLAILYAKIGKRNKAYDYFKEAISLREKFMDNDLSLANYYHNLAKLFEEDNNYEKAIYYYLKRTRLLEKNKYDNLLLDSYDTLGFLYMKNNDYPKAIKNYLKAKEILKNNINYENVTRIVDIDQKIISMSLINKYDDRVIDYYLESIKLMESLNDSRISELLAHTYMMIGNYYSQKCEYELAKEYYIKNISLREKINDSSLLVFSYIHLISFYGKIDDYDNAHLIKNKLDAIINSI